MVVWASVVVCTINTVLKVSEFGAEARAELSYYGSTLTGEIDS